MSKKSARTYKDCNGRVIEEGMVLTNVADMDKDVAVCRCGDAYGNEDLGTPAWNPKYHILHPDSPASKEFYSLSDFDLREWKIVPGVRCKEPGLTDLELTTYTVEEKVEE